MLDNMNNTGSISLSARNQGQNSRKNSGKDKLPEISRRFNPGSIAPSERSPYLRVMDENVVVNQDSETYSQ